MPEEETVEDNGIVLEGQVIELAKKADNDTSALVTDGSATFPDDSFMGQYGVSGLDSGNAIILEPTFKPGTLIALTGQNNILEQCVAAMEVNIDGTGIEIEPVDSEVEDEAEKQVLVDFFGEPYPGQTFVGMRRELRRDLESTGNGYMEAIRTATNDLVLSKVLAATNMRMIQLDEDVPVAKTVTRNGVEIAVTVRVRERRFVQNVAGNKIYFKEFRASRDIDRLTGKWAPKGTTLPLEKRGSEIIHFIINKEAKTPYGSPRWINQLPSVIGSRKAEEVNLDFFESGGVPPLLIIVQGGTLGTQLKQDLKQHFSKGAKGANRAAIVEAASTSGTLDKAGAVQVKVERFGSERQSDALFQNYDKNTAEHVRCGFRLPQLFIGKSEDMNFATARTAYMVAEAQVFLPERVEFDDIINNTIVKGLGVTKYKIRSLPVTLLDVEQQIAAIELAVTNKITPSSDAIDALNEVTGLTLESQEPPEPVVQPIAEKDPAEETATSDVVQPKADEVVTKKSARLESLADSWAVVIGLSQKTEDGNTVDLAAVVYEVEKLSAEDKLIFDEILVSKNLAKSDVDLGGLAELCGCADHLVVEDNS